MRLHIALSSVQSRAARGRSWLIYCWRIELPPIPPDEEVTQGHAMTPKPEVTVHPTASCWPSLLATFIVGQVSVCMGFGVGLHNIMIIQMPLDPTSPMSQEQLNWTIALSPLAAMVGCILAMIFSARLGVRRLLALTQPLYALASLPACLGGSFGWVLFGKVGMFAMIGISEGSARSYVSEIVPPNRRTLYMSIFNTMFWLCQGIGMMVAPHLHWRWMFLVAGFVPATICLAGLYFIPDSAKWLVLHGRTDEEALRSIRFFHGEHVDAAGEVRAIHESLHHTHVDGVPVPLWKLMWRRDTLVPLLFGSGQIFMFVWTGGLGVIYITSYILESVNLPLDEYQSAALPLAVGCCFAIPASFVIEHYGRLPLLRIGGAASAVGCAAIASYFFLPADAQLTSGWIVLVGVAITQIAFMCVVVPIAFTYASELLPTRTRMLGANILIFQLNMEVFILVRVYPLLRDTLGFGGVFVMHALVSLLQVAFATFCLPETKGLSLEQVQQLFQKAASTSEKLQYVADPATADNWKDNAGFVEHPSD